MTSLTISAMLIPGYDTLSEAERAVFEQSASGKKLIELRNSILNDQNELSKSSGFWHWFIGSASARKRKFETRLDQQIQEFYDSINTTEEYKTLGTYLIHNILMKEVGDFQLLTTEQRQLLSKAEISQKLFEIVTLLDRLLEQERQALSGKKFWESTFYSKIDTLQANKEEAFKLWKKGLQENPDMTPFRKTIEENKELMRKVEIARKFALLQEHATQLSTFFPLLNYRKFTSEEPIINQLRAKYASANGELTSDPDKVDEEQLTDLLFHCIQQVSAPEIDFIDLQIFNKESAKKMAAAVLKAFKEQSSLNLDAYFKEYEFQLHQYITKQLQLINGKDWQVKEAGVKKDLFDSLSYLWSNQVVSKTNEFISKLANAHGFIQATSFSARSDNSFLAILDIYNYASHQEQISETRTILSSLLSPLMPLYNEYKDIALYEKNSYWKSFRTMMPVLIVVASIILVAALLAPLVLPELAFAVAFIPALLLGLAIATKYVTTKNDLYKNLREKYYGGPFEIPEFQVNQRMLSAFGTQENAKRVREFYIEELKKCDALESDYSVKHEAGILTQEEINLRKVNTTKRHQLSLEWYDIHSNKDLSYNQASLVVLNRLQQTSDQEYVHLQTTLQGELDSIRLSVTEVATDIKANIITHNKLPVIETGKELEATTIKENYRYGLFTRPKTLTTKAHIEELDHFREEISQAAVC